MLYDGNGSTQSITGVGFQPDLLWGKVRNDTYDPVMTNSISGTGKYLITSSTAIEASNANGITSFDSDGFSVGSQEEWNPSLTVEDDMVVWSWLAGGAPTADNDNTSGAMDANSVSLNGSLQSSYTPSGSPSIYPTRMSINTTAGFSIISYTGNDTDGATVPHGLASKPDLIIVKALPSATNWPVYNSPQGATKTIWLDEDDDEGTGDSYWYDTEPTASVFSLGRSSQTNNTVDYISYVFHSVEGYSRIGKYEGNGESSDDAPFAYCGFRPAWVMIKGLETDVRYWMMYDNKRSPYNVVDDYLRADSNAAESAGSSEALDFVSNGFRIRTDQTQINPNEPCLFLAFAEAPFKYALAR